MDLRSMESQLEKLFEQKRLPGAAVCMLGPNNEIWARGFGHRDADGVLPVDENTIFGVASMSKSMTSLALCILEAEGRLSIDEPAAKYLPELRLPGIPQSALTIRHLMTHTSGLPPIEPLEWSIAMNSIQRDDETLRALRASSPNSMSTIGQVLDYIAGCKYPMLGMPGEYMSYSNEGYAALCYIFDSAAGEKLEDFVRERIYRPLGMTRTIMEDTCEGARAMSGGNITSLFERDASGNLVCDDDWSVLPPFRGCAMVKSTARDMAVYYRCLADLGRHEGRQVIPQAAAERMYGAEFPLRERPYYCLGLNKRLFRGHVICEHAGALHGVSTHGGFISDQGWGFAALSNLGEAETCQMTWTMMNAVMGLPIGTDHGWSHPVSYAFDMPEALTGDYLGHEGEPTNIRVALKDGGISIEKGGETLRAVYCGGTLFNAYRQGDDELLNRAEFLLRGGNAWAMRWGTRIYERIR